MIAETFLIIRDALLSARNAADETIYKHVDLFNANLEQITKGGIFDTPAVFVEFKTIKTEDSVTSYQKADIPIALHLITKEAAKMGYDATLSSEQFDRFRLLTRLYQIVKDLRYNSDQFAITGVNRTGIDISNSHAELIDDIMMIDVSVIDATYIDEETQERLLTLLLHINLKRDIP